MWTIFPAFSSEKYSERSSRSPQSDSRTFTCFSNAAPAAPRSLLALGRPAETRRRAPRSSRTSWEENTSLVSLGSRDLGLTCISARECLSLAPPCTPSRRPSRLESLTVLSVFGWSQRLQRAVKNIETNPQLFATVAVVDSFQCFYGSPYLKMISKNDHPLIICAVYVDM